MSFKDNKLWNRCDECGQFIPLADFEDGKASRKLITPDSDYSSEEFETLCRKHMKPTNTKTSYFTFGQCHTHSAAGKTLDKDTVVKITDINPREKMFRLFGAKWSMEYSKKPDMRLFPKGIVEL